MKKEIANYGNPKISNNANITNFCVFVKIPTGIGVKVDVEFKLSLVGLFDGWYRNETWPIFLTYF